MARGVKAMIASEASTAQLQSLLNRAAATESHYDQFVAHAMQRLLRLTRRMLQNYPRLRRWEDTDDVFQSVAVRLHRALIELRPQSVGEAFGLASLQVRRTLIDLCRHYFGPQGKAAHYQSDPHLADAAFEQASSDGGPISLQDWTHFHEAVDRLPEALREVFQLIWYGGVTQKEVAQMLGISLATVQRRWYGAQVYLHQVLTGTFLPEE